MSRSPLKKKKKIQVEVTAAVGFHIRRATANTAGFAMFNLYTGNLLPRSSMFCYANAAMLFFKSDIFDFISSSRGRFLQPTEWRQK